MRVPFDFGKCILCLERPADSWEHVIPECLGGRLQLRILCAECNNKFGSEFVSGLRSDMSIRIAFENLKSRLPDLYQSAQDGLPFVGRRDDGSAARVSLKDGKVRVIPGRNPDGSLTLDERNARRKLERVLAEGPIPTEEKARYVRMFDSLANDVPLYLPGGHRFAKRAIPPLSPELKGELVDNRVPALIAYEFLAFLSGPLIYDHRLDDARQYIRTGAVSDRITIERGGAEARAYDTYHSLDIVVEPPQVTVFVRFFRYLIFSVRFDKLAFALPDPVYLEDVEARKGLLALSRADAREGKFINMGVAPRPCVAGSGEDALRSEVHSGEPGRTAAPARPVTRSGTGIPTTSRRRPTGRATGSGTSSGSRSRSSHWRSRM